MERSDHALSRVTGRLHWRLQSDTATHDLDILLPFLRPATITVDGRRVAELPKPTPRNPWVETGMNVGGHEVTVALSGRALDVWTDVFQDGVSLIDGRSLDDARAAAPVPVGRFEDWTAGPVTGISSTRLVPPLLVTVAIVSLALMAVGILAIGPGVLGAALLGLGMIGWFAPVLMRTWMVGVAKFRAYLVGRDDLADEVRLGLLVLMFVGGALAVFGLFLAPIALLSALSS